MGPTPAEAWTLCLCGLLCLSLTVLVDSTWITNLPDGLDLETDEDVYVVAGQWSVLITIDPPRPSTQYIAYLLQFERTLMDKKGELGTIPWLPSWMQRLKMLYKQCFTPRRWWRVSSEQSKELLYRPRRGLIDVVGEGMKFLFGSATSRDIDQIRRLVANLTATQQRILTQVEQFTTIINHTYDEIQVNRDQINIISQNLHNLSAWAYDALQGMNARIKLMDFRIQVEFLLAQFEDVGRRYISSHEAWLHRKENLEAGRLTENLLPPTVLQGILAKSAEPTGRAISPLHWYYANIMITPILVGEDRLIYHTVLPLVLSTEWHYTEIRRWPAPMNDYQATLVLPDTILRDTETGDITISPRCYGTQPRVCRRGLITRADKHPCLTRLLASRPSYDHECAVIIEKRFPLDTVHPIAYDDYILITDGTQLALRCADAAENIVTVAAGVYRITLPFPCNLYGTEWTLKSTFQRTLNLTLRTQEANVHVNITIADLFNEKYELDPFRLNLTQMNAVDRRQLKVSDLVLFGDTLKKAGKNPLWHNFWLLTLGGLAVGVVYGRRLYRRRHPAKPAETKIELHALETKLEAATPPRTDEIFEFKAPNVAKQQSQS